MMDFTSVDFKPTFLEVSKKPEYLYRIKLQLQARILKNKNVKESLDSDRLKSWSKIVLTLTGISRKSKHDSSV